MKGLLAAAAVLASSTLAFAQTPPSADKPSVAKYMSEGYDVVRAEIGNPFLQFILRKDKALVWCSVQVQTGETSNCRTIK